MLCKTARGTILALALISALASYAQQCGQPDFQCSGEMTCECDGNWECAGAECPLPPPNNGTCNEGSAIECTGSGWQCVPQGSPIVIDVKKEGYHLTSLDKGVKFPFFPGSAPIQLSWTDAAYSNGFLVLDRNGDGVINDGSELFGSETPQPPIKHPNGFNALGVYDLPANGGNDNGIIDPGDAIYAKLQIWIDANHNGLTDPGELHSLAELGIASIGLKYHLTPLTDQYGNKFRYAGDYRDSSGNERDRLYDVLLVLGSGPTSVDATPTPLSALWTVPEYKTRFDRIKFQRSRGYTPTARLLTVALGQAHDQTPQWGYEAHVSQSGTAVTIHSNGPRPMRDAVQVLSRRYGWAIDYEGPVLGSSETYNATDPTWRQKHPNERGYTAIRGGEFVSSYDEASNPPSSSQSRFNILEKLTNSYRLANLPSKFKVEMEDAAHLDVVGRNPAGTAPAFFDALVSLKPQPTTASQAIDNILVSASKVSGIRAVWASGPVMYLSKVSVTPSGSSAPARVELRQILDQTDLNLYWALLYDPNTRTYHLNLAPVVRNVISPDGHTRLEPVRR